MKLRMNLRTTLGALCTTVLLATLYWIYCAELPRRPESGSVLTERSVSERSRSPGVEDAIQCSINGEYTVACLKRRDEVYLPFSFIHKYFEVYGKITFANDVEKFEWSHSYGKIYHPKKKYDPRGTFTTFENYNVEVRDRVKCISAIEGVPVSTQWDPRGFYYPTQIAQFGLAHYSKNITEPEPRIRILEDGEKHLENWIKSEDASMTREYDSAVRSDVLRFTTSAETTSQVWLMLNVSQDFILRFDVLLEPNSSITVELQSKEKRETVYLHYIPSSQLIYAQGDHIYYGLGMEQRWRRLTRDLLVDMQKGWALLDRPKRKLPRNKFKISSVILSGRGSLDNLTLSQSAHWEQFMATAEWLQEHQNPRTGGWPVPVRRRLAAGQADLQPGWHSAMSQGHAMSVLSRAYARTGDIRFLEAGRRALRPLHEHVTVRGAGGVLNRAMDKYVWYEEYPTTPPMFVLNGFIYALLGLYDLHIIEGDNSVSLAKKLFDDGMSSLKTLLPLFDTGSGSFYDLRHFTLGVSPNIARWDYHATHVNQLYLLAGIDSDPILINTAKRWEGYMSGKRAAHN